MNKNLADKIENYSYMRHFGEEEMESMRIEQTEIAIHLKGEADELKKIKQEFKERNKPKMERHGELLLNLKNKAELVTRECYYEFDQDLGIAKIYNSDGEMVGQRPLMENERQKTIFATMRTGTND